MTQAPPADVLAAIGRLNALARGCRGPWTPREAIYAYKTAVALALIQQGAAQVRFVRLETRCTCGDGWWRDWYSDEKRRCARCSGTTKVTLRFTETTLPDRQIWHHPWEGRVAPGYELGHAFVGQQQDLWTDKIVWADAGDWRPRQPAIEIPLRELATLLNTVEDWIEQAPDDRTWSGAKRFLCQRKHKRVSGPNSHAYRLDLGTATSCRVCRALPHEDDPQKINRYGMLSPLFHWTVWTCERHKIEHPQIRQRDLAPDDELLTPPIRQWLVRHCHVVEVEW